MFALCGPSEQATNCVIRLRSNRSRRNNTSPKDTSDSTYLLMAWHCQVVVQSARSGMIGWCHRRTRGPGPRGQSSRPVDAGRITRSPSRSMRSNADGRPWDSKCRIRRSPPGDTRVRVRICPQAAAEDTRPADRCTSMKCSSRSAEFESTCDGQSISTEMSSTY